MSRAEIVNKLSLVSASAEASAETVIVHAPAREYVRIRQSSSLVRTKENHDSCVAHSEITALVVNSEIAQRSGKSVSSKHHQI